MASTSNSETTAMSTNTVEELKRLLWGSDIKTDVFRRWTQGFVFSEDEPTALLQFEGGPCAVIAPVQGYILKNMFFGKTNKDNWKNITEAEATDLLCSALEDILTQVKSTQDYYLVSHHTAVEENKIKDTCTNNEQCDQTENNEDGESSPKKRRIGHEQFHGGLSCHRCGSTEELRKQLRDYIPVLKGQHGVLLTLCSIVLTKGIDQIKNEVEDPSEPLIDGTYGHGSQSLINLLLTGKAVTNVWDNDKEVSGLKLHGISRQSTLGFMTLLEHLRYCEVGWYMKNPQFPIWILGSETHLTVLFSEERNLVTRESPEATAHRLFGTFDTEGSGFISASLLGDLMAALELVSEPEYVKIMQDKLDPEQLGIITLNTFMEEFFPSDNKSDAVQSFVLYHYNGLKRSCPDNKVTYQEASAVITELPEMQLISDSSPIKMCLMTKWPTIELQWKNTSIPSLN